MTFAGWHLLIALIPVLPNLWSIWHIWTHSFATPERRMYWFLLAVFLPVIGGIIYIAFGRRQVLARMRHRI